MQFYYSNVTTLQGQMYQGRRNYKGKKYIYIFQREKKA